MPSTEHNPSKRIPLHVAVGIIENNSGEILISKRHEKQDQGGLWEFPGGKIIKGESVYDALKRELKEELSIDIQAARPFIKLHHDYPDYSVLLDVWKVNKFNNEAIACEGQEILWLDKGALREKAFPDANYPIITALDLPSVYFITPEPDSCKDEAEFLQRVSVILESGCKLIQFRSKLKSIDVYMPLISRLRLLCEKYTANLMVNSDVNSFNGLDVDGLHLSSERLMQAEKRPVAKSKLLGVSCHTEEELKQASIIDADFIVLGSVKETNSHQVNHAMGWDTFGRYIENLNIPTYALGGMSLNDLETAWQYGGHGVAMISDLWQRTSSNSTFSILK